MIRGTVAWCGSWLHCFLWLFARHASASQKGSGSEGYTHEKKNRVRVREYREWITASSLILRSSCETIKRDGKQTKKERVAASALIHASVTTSKLYLSNHCTLFFSCPPYLPSVIIIIFCGSAAHHTTHYSHATLIRVCGLNHPLLLNSFAVKVNLPPLPFLFLFSFSYFFRLSTLYLFL